MAYTSSTPAITDISIQSIQGHCERLWHNAVFLMMLSGEVQVQVNGHPTCLNDNGIMLVEPDTPFVTAGRGSNLLLLIRMDYDFYMQGKTGRFGTIVCNSAEDTERDYSLLRHLLSHIAMNYFSSMECRELRLLEMCYSVIYYLNTTHFVAGDFPARGECCQELRGRQVLSYIECNYMQDMRLKDLAEVTHLSISYLSRMFKRITGMNFKAFLEQVRLFHAVEDMRNTAQTITTIAYNNGFPNVSALSNAIRKQYQMAPNEFRKTLKMQPPEAAKPLPYTEVEYDTVRANIEALAGPEPARSLGLYRYPDKIEYLVEDVSKFHPIRPIWKTMINIGTMRGLANVNVKAQLALLQSEIGFKYARIECVLTEESIPKIANGQYNFSYFDRAMELLLGLKLIPFLDLSFRGDYILFTRSKVIHRGEKPRNGSTDREFREKVSALIRHCINTFGADEVENWGLEICALHEEMLQLLETPEEYVLRFQTVHQIVKAWLPNMLIGGPEYNIAIDCSFLREVVERLKEKGIRPDFISVCAVPYESTKTKGTEQTFVVSPDPDYIQTCVRKVRDILDKQICLDCPIWVTALGPDIRIRNHINDSCYQASFLAKNTIDLIDMVDVIGYWQLSDIGAEYIDTTRILFGGTGIISKDGLKKTGFTFLKRMAGINTLLIQKERNILVTTNNINTYNVVLCNYAHFTDLYCLNGGEGLSIENMYTAFGDAATRDIDITLKGLPCGRYKIISTTLNRESGSLFDEWLRYGIVDELQLHDIHYLQDIVHPQRAVRYYECEDTSVKLTMQMLPHEVKYLTLIREL